ncbi:MAG: alpha/beta hydrolase [bacterium]
MRFGAGVICLVGTCASAACGRGADAPARALRPPTPTIRLVRTAPDVSLETIDWGGTGPTMVFLAGLGNTAHVFDEFAPQFADSFHVVGITRRGFGASAGAVPPNDVDSLVADIRAVLDTLRAGRVILVGHSIAGEELTRFGETDADRCAGLVYLDAAYDRTTATGVGAAPVVPPPPRRGVPKVVSLDDRRAYGARVMGVLEPMSEVRATSRSDSSGQYLGEIATVAAQARVKQAVRAPHYDRVRCRSLAIYATPDAPVDVVPYYAELDSAGRGQAESVLTFVTAFVARSRQQFTGAARHQVVEIRGNHLVFLQRPDDVARIMRSFLSGGVVQQAH